MAKRRTIRIKNAREIDHMRVAGRTASAILQEAIAAGKPGVTAREIGEEARALMKREGCKSAFLGYRGFPGFTCISVNEEVVHGIGGPRVVHPGDILKIDVGIVKNGWIGDNATTVPVGDVPDATKRLLAATEQSLYEAIDKARAGLRLAELCGAVEEHVKPLGFSVVREFVGHGVGRKFHQEPSIPHYPTPESYRQRLLPGMTFTIEPMINEGTRAGEVDKEDGWTVRTKDGKLSAQFEHTILMTEDGPEPMTLTKEGPQRGHTF